MIYYLLLIVSLAGAVAKNLLPKADGKSFSTIDGLMSVNIISGIIGMMIIAFGGIDIKNVTNAMIVVLAMLYGIFTLAMQSFYMTAAQRGSVSVCSLIYSSCFVIQTVFFSQFTAARCVLHSIYAALR